MTTSAFVPAPFHSSLRQSKYGLISQKCLLSNEVSSRKTISRPARLPLVSMTSGDDENLERVKTDKRDQDDGNVSFWGVASFGIILAIFLVGIIATLARDFIPGGVTTPVP